MTADLKLMVKFRDAKVAEDFGKMAALGWLDTEFTMYGCAYWDREKDAVFYRISPNDIDIYSFIENCSDIDCYPSNILQYSKTIAVPIGMKEVVALEVKKELAKKLRALYSKEFFKVLYQIAKQCQSDMAAELLWNKAEQLEGVFDEDKLNSFDQLIRYTYSCRKIKSETFQKLLEWVAEERSNMDDNYIEKDIFEKEMYGIAYEEDGRIQYMVNAQASTIYGQKYELEQNRIFVTPIYTKKYWYNYTYRLQNVIKDFKEELKNKYNEQYLDEIKKIQSKNTAASDGDLERFIRDIEEKYGSIPAETVLRYVSRWGIR